MNQSVRAFVGLGSNQDDPKKQILGAFEELAKIEGVGSIVCSSLYESDPVGFQDQPDFINAVCRFETGMDAEELLLQLQKIENRAGRDRSGPQWGPRTLDLDLLLYGGSILHTKTLVLPHPGMHERAFVLYPLLEIEPQLMIPGHGLASKLVENCTGQQCAAIRSVRS